MGFRPAADQSRPYSLRTVPFANSSSTYEHFLSQLSKGTQYAVIVKAYNFAGSGPESAAVVAKTLSGDFPPTPKVQLVSVATDSVSLVFRVRQDEFPDLRITGFVVHYRQDAGSVWKQLSIPVEMNRVDGSCIVKELTPNAIYYFFVAAVNNDKHGDPSELLTVKTRATDTPVLSDTPFSPGDRMSVMFGHYQQDVQTYISVGGRGRCPCSP